MKKTIALPILLSSCIIASTIFPYYGIAEQVPIMSDTNTDSNNTKTELTYITEQVKNKITIPKNFTVFTYELFNENSAEQLWNLLWEDTEKTKSIEILADKNAKIKEYRFYDSNQDNVQPIYQKSQLKATADSFIKNAAPDLAEHIKFTSSASQNYSNQYTYIYQRIENNTPVPDNIIKVRINYGTGKVMNYQANWDYSIDFSSEKAKLTKEEAKKLIQEKVKMKLAYRTEYSNEQNIDNPISAFLAYYPELDYIAVDALTGEIYKTRIKSQDQSAGTGNMEDAAADEALVAGKQNQLTQNEINEIDKIKDIISKEKAIQTIKQNNSLLLDDNLTKITARLYKQSNNAQNSNEVYLWNIDFEDPNDIDYAKTDFSSRYAQAQINAKTGKIISFYSDIKNYNNREKDEWKNIKVANKETSKKVIENFAKSQLPEYFEQMILSENKPCYIIGYDGKTPVYGGYSYNYNRVYQDIPYLENGIYAEVDGTTGKIYQFNFTWNEAVSFEKPTNLITAQKAFDNYMALEGYKLVYEINPVYHQTTNLPTQENKTRLVYHTDIFPGLISPTTGKQLDFNGKPFENTSYTYTDIDTHAAKNSILLLSDLGVGFSGGKFLPDTAITQQELTKLITNTNLFSQNRIEVNQSKQNNQSISRLNAAKYAIQILGLEKIAALDGIYTTDWQEELSASDFGYASLAKGLKLLEPNHENKYNFQQPLTRGEAAQMIIAMINNNNIN